MAIHEECGVFGVMSTKRENVASIAYYPASCGIMISAYVINQFLKEGEKNGIIK